MQCYIKELIDALNAVNCDESNGEYIATCISRAFNCYENYNELAIQIHDKLTKLGKKKFFTCISLAMMELSHVWRVNDGDYWDKRKTAVMRFASLNVTYFETLFIEQNGYKLEINHSDTYFPYCIASKEVKQSYSNGFILAWSNIHPTTQRSFISGVLNGVFVKKLKVSFIGTGENGTVIFPFL